MIIRRTWQGFRTERCDYPTSRVGALQMNYELPSIDGGNLHRGMVAEILKSLAIPDHCASWDVGAGEATAIHAIRQALPRIFRLADCRKVSGPPGQADAGTLSAHCQSASTLFEKLPIPCRIIGPFLHYPVSIRPRFFAQCTTGPGKWRLRRICLGMHAAEDRRENGLISRSSRIPRW